MHIQFIHPNLEIYVDIQTLYELHLNWSLSYIYQFLKIILFLTETQHSSHYFFTIISFVQNYDLKTIIYQLIYILSDPEVSAY